MRRTTLLLAVLACVATSEAPDEETAPSTESAETADLHRYTTCGDPVCGGYSGPFSGVPVCSTELEGEACSAEGEQCDLETSCNTLLVCAAEDPKDQPGGCPISRRAYKEDVHYLAPEELSALHRQLLDTRLATWRYRWGEDTRLGFVIDDAPDSAAVTPDGERVDLYGFTTMTAASVQVQQGELEAMRAELDALRGQVEALRRECEGAP